MRPAIRWTALLLPAAVLALAAAPAGRADKPVPGPLDRTELDAVLYRTFRDVINRGADLYNSGDTAGCYRLYEGALLTVQPLLDHRPELQQAVAKALADAANTPQQFERAFVLRHVIDRLRATVRPGAATAAPAALKAPMATPPEPKTAGTPKPGPRQVEHKPVQKKTEPKEP
jgi:hypothetical protein